MTDCSAKNSGRGNAVDLMEDLLKAAIRSGASDVHFEPTSQGLVVRFRLDGVLEDVEKLPKSLAESVVSRLKVLGGF